MAANDPDGGARALGYSKVSGPRKATSKSSGKESEETAGSSDTIADVSAKARDLISQILEFLSNASNETLGACIVALGATTWLILGRVGLVLIGIVGGVVLHATWERDGHGHTNEEVSALEAKRRREKGLDVVGRVLDWRKRTRGSEEPVDAETRSLKTLDFSEFQPETGAALTTLTDAVIRDYVKYVRGHAPSYCENPGRRG